MTPERWRQVKEIFDAALERNPTERAAFLSVACADDELLKSEIESLLAADASESGFLKSPARYHYRGYGLADPNSVLSVRWQPHSPRKRRLMRACLWAVRRCKIV
ncbi:MAG: hypothetical protein M3367_12940 [Acidobacteriota bacterium]|nr:hypothetical protein [Acidobacteriota bacterium]